MDNKIALADFSRYPGGRSGALSGRNFREEVLSPAIAKGDFPIIINLDNVVIIAPAFLDESLGALIREYGAQRFDEIFKVEITDDLDAQEDWAIIKRTSTLK